MAPNPQSEKPNGTVHEKTNGSMQALVKVEKLTQIAFALPVAALIGWFAGAMLDRLLHTHWVYIAGLVLGVVAGFWLLFRMIASPGMLADTAYDPQAGKGPGFNPSGHESPSGGPGFHPSRNESPDGGPGFDERLDERKDKDQ